MKKNNHDPCIFNDLITKLQNDNPLDRERDCISGLGVPQNHI